MICKTAELLDLTKTKAAPLLSGVEYPWEVLDKLKSFILELGQTLPEEEYDHPQPDVWVAKDALIFGSASIKGPCIIGHSTEVRHCAFIRGSALVGDGCVVGNSTELKNVILFDGVQVPHFNYVGDSVLGYKAHMGAGAITSNVKSDNTGDGIITAIKLMQAMLENKLPLSKLAEPMVEYPQVLKNVRVTDKDGALNAEPVKEAVARAEVILGDSGRVLLRKSGTEPVLRVMAEARDETTCEELADGIIGAIKDAGMLA